MDKAIIVDVSPVTTSPALKSMSGIFQAIRRIRLPPQIELSEARKMADEQIREAIQDKMTRSFILMNLYQAYDGS